MFTIDFSKLRSAIKTPTSKSTKAQDSSIYSEFAVTLANMLEYSRTLKFGFGGFSRSVIVVLLLLPHSGC